QPSEFARCLLPVLLPAIALIAGCGGSDRPASEPVSPATAAATKHQRETSPRPPDSTAREAADTSGVEEPGVAELSSEPIADAAPKQNQREPIYDPEADGEALIAAALERAKAEHKHVLIEWGGNWCGWCFKLHDVFTTDEQVRPIVQEEY